MNDPKVTIKDLVSDNWDSDNTSSVTPTFSTGWYDRKSLKPQVTFTDPTETPVSSGTVPFFGIVSGGAPSQYLRCTVAVNVWCERNAVDINPKQCVYELKEEIKRIILENWDGIDDLDYVAGNGSNEVVETDPPPPVFRSIGEITYGFLDT